MTILRRAALAASCAVPALCGAGAAIAQTAGTLYVTSSTYVGTKNTVVVGQALPNTNGKTAIADGTYPTVFNNDSVDPNFGITSPITVTAQTGVYAGGAIALTGQPTFLNITGLTGVSTSFPSKSELGIHLSTDGSALTFTGYRAAPNVLDVSNTNTLLHIDSTNTDTQSPTYRTVVRVNLANGTVTATDTNAYSGNNMRGAILAVNANGGGSDEFLLTGNAGNGSGTEPTYIVNDTGVQLVAPGAGPATTVVGVQNGTPGAKNGFQYGFAVQNIGDTADKSGKDDNFRGIAVFNNTLYVSKGSGGNGIDTVYQVGAAGTLPTAATAAATAVNILPGLPTGLATNIVNGNPATEFYPFGIWFANATTMYVADEGPQDLSTDVNAGLQKWTFDGTKWNLAYTIQRGLNLDQPYNVPNYPAQYAPATTGLRHLAGIANGNSVVLFATTATISALADPGADPNQVVEVVDQLDATTLPPAESFTTLFRPWPRQVYRGVEFVAPRG